MRCPTPAVLWLTVSAPLVPTNTSSLLTMVAVAVAVCVRDRAIDVGVRRAERLATLVVVLWRMTAVGMGVFRLAGC